MRSGVTGTLITFLPDPTIFTITSEFKFERLATRLRELAFLNPGLEVTLTDERTASPKKETFFYKHGIEEFVKQLGENKQVLHPKPIVISRQRDEVFIDVVLQYNDSYNDQILCFANSIPNPDGRLKPQMYTSVEIKINLGSKLAIPDDAVIDTGTRQIVYVDKGDGYFEPREVMLGLRAEGYREVLMGLKDGEKVAASAAFLVDSEAQLKGDKPLEGAGHKH